MATQPLTQRFGALAAGLAAFAAPAVALACPQCAGRAGGGPGQTIALGAFILLPFVVTGAILKIIRAERSSTEHLGAIDHFGGPASEHDTARRRVE